ncbi:hypothetical protein, partial [Anabaena sp. UHCC 0204]|uniref:beta strand repeat-containing protein n=1 Tax=Anabaena sp. UHCC 0204 TaxID=2590009 RepID=UPI001C2BCC95
TAANTNIANNITTTGNQQFTNDVTLTGTNSNQELKADTGTIAFNNNLIAGNNNLTLTANEVNLLGVDNSVTGSGKLLIQPSISGQNINIGDDTDTSSLDITGSDIDALAKGFSDITIGRNDSSGAIAINTVNFKDAVKIQSPTGSITTNGEITGEGSITLDAITTTLNAGITTINQNINFSQSVIFGNDITLSTGAGIGDITFSGTVDGNQNLTLNTGTGNINFDAAVGGTNPLNSLSTSTANTNVKANITTVNDLNFTNAVTLTGITQTFNSGNGNINFSDTVNGASDLTVIAGNEITLNGAVGVNLKLNSLTSTATKTNVEDNIFTSGNITFNNPLNLIESGAKLFSADNGNISFNSTVNGNSALTTLATNGIISFKDVVQLSSLTNTATQTQIANNILTTGDIKINSNLINLTGTTNQELKSDSGKIELSGNLTAGSNNLTL